MLAPGFIGITIFFHQVYLIELRGWTVEAFAGSYAFMALLTVCFALIGGVLIDRFSSLALLPTLLIPLGFACFLLAWVEQTWGIYAFMAFLGTSYGLSSTLFGAVWPKVYGTRHLGSIRAIVVALMVFATALGPGVTGFLIDYSAKIMVMGLYCPGGLPADGRRKSQGDRAKPRALDHCRTIGRFLDLTGVRSAPERAGRSPLIGPA